MICAYTSIHTYYSVLKKGAPTIYFAKKKKKKRMKLEDVMLKNIGQTKKKKKKLHNLICRIFKKSAAPLTVSCEFPFCVYSAGMKYLEDDFGDT